jgi:hypothetical protein
MNTRSRYTTCGAVVTLLVLTAGSAHADLVVDVTLNTAPLTTAPATSAGPFSLAFQLVQGSQANNNTATISNFLFGAGGSPGSGCPAVLAPCTFGGASGDISSRVSLNTSNAFNALVETFTPGSSLSFLLDLTTNVNAGGTPDAFAFSILDSSGSSIPTLDSTGADTLLTINIDSDNPAILTYTTDPSLATLGGSGPSLTMDAPVVSAAVPEPRTLTLLGLCVLFARLFQRHPGRASLSETQPKAKIP